MTPSSQHDDRLTTPQHRPSTLPPPINSTHCHHNPQPTTLPPPPAALYLPSWPQLCCYVIVRGPLTNPTSNAHHCGRCAFYSVSPNHTLPQADRPLHQPITPSCWRPRIGGRRHVLYLVSILCRWVRANVERGARRRHIVVVQPRWTCYPNSTANPLPLHHITPTPYPCS
jgi:hypothetical protein